MRKLSLVLLSAILLCGLPVDAEKNKPAKRAYRKGKRMISRSDFIRSVPFLKEATNLDPENAWYHFLLGKAHFEGDRPKEALPALLRAYKLDRTVHKDIEFYLARSLHFNHLFEDAINHYTSDLQNYAEGSSDYMDTQMRIQQCQNAPEIVEKEKYYKVDNLGEYVNSEYPEYAATFSENYSFMIFTSRRPRKLRQLAKRRYHVRDIHEEVYEASKVDGEWKKTKLFSRPIPHKTHDASVAMSEDGSTLLYYVARRGGDIFVSFNEDGKWSKKESIGENINTADYNEPHAFLADGGSTLYFVSDKEGGKGLKDLYMSKKDENGEWGEGVSLGDAINTPYDEDAPFISADGQYLYFSSRGHNSMGGYDLFRCTKQGNGWSAPENLGYPINSVGDDIYFVQESGSEGFFYASDRPGGYGEKDIYYAYPFVPEDVQTIIAGNVLTRTDEKPLAAEVSLIDKETGEVLETTSTDPSDGSYKFLMVECGKEYDVDVKVDAPDGPAIVKTGQYNVVSGFLKDAITDKPLDGEVELLDLETGKVIDQIKTNPETGNYMLPVQSGARYMLRARSNEYLTYYEEFNVSPTGEIIAHSHEIGLQRQTEAEKLVINWEFFDHDKDVIKREYYKDLDHVVDVMNKIPEIKLNVIGHTDSDGTDSYNQKLSERRADAVAEYLTEKGIDSKRLNVSGMGEAMPLYDNSNKSLKKWNRRVELYIIN